MKEGQQQQIELIREVVTKWLDPKPEFSGISSHEVANMIWVALFMDSGDEDQILQEEDQHILYGNR